MYTLCRVVVSCLFVVGTLSLEDDVLDPDSTMVDPYTGELLRIIQTKEQQLDKCYLSISNKSSKGLESLLELYHPNFVHIHLNFELKNISCTKEAILPFNWVWTYYSPEGFFPYLKWPVDFPILSFGLLDVKTLPLHYSAIRLDVQVTGNCQLKMGDKYTTNKIAMALRDLTADYILHLNPTMFSFSYWCFLHEVPNKTDTMSYLLGVYLGYPVEVAGYKCCRTGVPKTTNKDMYIHCIDYLIPKMFQVTIIPYVIGLIAFACFPVFLLKMSEKLIVLNNGHHLKRNIHEETLLETLVDDGEEWLYLDGQSSPITLTSLVCGLCGLVKRHPTAVSRLRRLLFIVLSPCLLFAKLCAYGTFQFKMTMALLDHHVPMGFLSMLGGYEKSRLNFVPALGGPYVLLGFFFVFGFLIMVLPEDLNYILHKGAIRRNRNRQQLTSLYIDEETMEDLSGINIVPRHGYGKVAAVCTGGLLMLTNPRFWSRFFVLQYKRYIPLYKNIRCKKCPRCISLLLFMICIPLLILVGTLEASLCIAFYGIPVVSFMFMASKGFISVITKTFIHAERITVSTGSQSVSQILNTTRNIFRYGLAVFTFALFVCFMFSFCSIFTTGFSFVAKLLMFSLVAVIVYPSYTFGYLFFGIVLLYYIYKLLRAFGEGYSELLTDAVEISVQLCDEVFQLQVFNGTICLTRTNGADIKRIQIHDKLVTLSPEQVIQIKEAMPSNFDKIRENEYLIGIPKELFDILVKKYRPVHHEIAKSILWLVFVISLILITTSILVVKNMAPSEGISEVMHVLFIMVVGALPEVLGIILDKSDHFVKKEIKMKKIKATIQEFWIAKSQDNSISNSV